MRIAIIGAGVAGLASARRCLENGFEPVVYERSKTVGGTWVYDERTGLDEFDLPIHTSMYQNLMTNLPKELMDYPDFPYEDLDGVSFLKSRQVLEYIERFTEHFDLGKYIRFCHLVTSVERLENVWQVTAEDLPTKTSNAEYYGAVIVCNGHLASPSLPRIPGLSEFDGVQIHSHDYRVPERFANMNVLVIGSGPSGIDISLDVAEVANQVYLSHHKQTLLTKKFSNNVVQKPDVEYFTENSAFFKDKTVQTIDAIIHCTGFGIVLPFLKPSCGIRVINENLITPLHKSIINMNNPTMGFIGFLFNTLVNRVFDLQVRYYMEFLRKNRFSREDWMSAASTHRAAENLPDYCKSLATEEIEVEPIPRVVFEAHKGCHELTDKYFMSYHSAVFKIVDDDTYQIEIDENNLKSKQSYRDEHEPR